jgi:hypothetical protein
MLGFSPLASAPIGSAGLAPEITPSAVLPLVGSEYRNGYGSAAYGVRSYGLDGAVFDASAAVVVSSALSVDATRVREGAEQINVTASCSASSLMEYQAGAQVDVFADVLVTGNRVQAARASSAISCIVSANGRLKWEADADTVETWSEQADAETAWADQPSTSASWVDQADTAKDWTPASSTAEIWTQAA